MPPPDDFDAIERRFGGSPAAPAIADFDAIEAKFGQVSGVRAAIFGDAGTEAALPLSEDDKAAYIKRLFPGQDYDPGSEVLSPEEQQRIFADYKREPYVVGAGGADPEFTRRTAVAAFDKLFGPRTVGDRQQIEEILAKHAPKEASAGERAQYLGGQFMEGMNAPAMGYARRLFGRGGALENPASLEAAENVANPSRKSIGDGRFEEVRKDVESTFVGRTLSGAAHLAGATPGLLATGAALTKPTVSMLNLPNAIPRVIPALAAGPTALGLNSLASSGGDVAAAGEGVAFGAIAGALSIPLKQYIASLPIALQSKAVDRLATMAAGGLEFAAADAILHGPDGERALTNFIFGAGMKSVGTSPGQARAKELTTSRATYPDPVEAARGVREGYDRRLAQVESTRPATPAIDPVAEAKATAAEFDARPAPEPTAPEKPVSVAPVAPDAPASKTLVGTDKRGREVWEVRGKFYVRDTGGRLGTAHPQEVAEAKASAQAPAPEPARLTDLTPPEAKTGNVPVEPPVEARPMDAAPAEAKSTYGSKNTVVTKENYEAAKAALKAKLGQTRLNSNIDPTILADLVTIGAYHLESGVRDFASWARVMLQDYGDAIRPHLRSVWEDSQKMGAAVGRRPDEAPAPRPGKQAERGALSLAPVGEFLGEVAGGVRKVFGETISRVRAYKTPAAEETARKATEAVDAAKAFRGEMGRELLAAEKLAGQPVVTKLGRAATELATPTKVPGETFTEPTLYEAIEGRRQPASPEEARIIASIRQLIWKAGEITEREGMPQRDSQGNYNPFVNRTDKVAPRITAEGYHEIIQMGPSSRAWNPMVDAFAKRNPQIPRARLEDHFKTMHEEMAGEGPQAAGAKAQAEFTREIPNVPATVEVGGRTFRLFETNPATYLRRFAETRAQRLGFGKAFGYDVPGQTTPVQDLRERFAKETGKPDEFVNLTRELHGHAKDAPIIDPGSITGGVFRNADRAWSVAREALLSASAVVNTPESLGATQHLVGTRRLAKAIYVAFRGKSHPMNAAVDALGATTRDAINASYDPANPRGSVARMMTEMLSRTFGRKFVEEFQERVAAVGGKMMADDMQAGKGSGYDIQSLKTMGWSDADARRLAKGGGTQAEYDAISRRLPTVAVGANQSKAEKSWFQNTRVLRPLNAIASYAHTTIRNAFSAHKAFVDTMGRVVDGTGLTPKERWAGTFRAFQHLSGFYVAKTLQGAAAAMLAATVGRSLGIKKAEAEDDPFDFAAKSFISSTFGGPYAATARAMFGDGNLSQISPQVSVALEAIDALNGNGKYRDLPLSERMAQLATRFLPVYRVMRSMAVAIGLGNEQSQDIENARSAYWRWRKGFDKTTFTGKEAETDAEQTYRTALKSAYLAMTRGGEPEEVAKRVLSAIGGEDAIGKDKKKAAESIRRRMLLTAPAVKGKLDALKSRIGDKAYKTLEAHDALLESLADSVQRGG